MCCPHSSSQWCDCTDLFQSAHVVIGLSGRKARECMDNWHPLIPTLMSLQLRALVFWNPWAHVIRAIWVAVIRYICFVDFSVDFQVWFSESFNRSLAIAVSSEPDILFYPKSRYAGWLAVTRHICVLVTYWNVLGSRAILCLIAGGGTRQHLTRNIMDIGEGEPLFGNFEYEDFLLPSPYQAYFGILWTVTVWILGTTTHYRCTNFFVKGSAARCNRQKQLPFWLSNGKWWFLTSLQATYWQSVRSTGLHDNLLSDRLLDQSWSAMVALHCFQDWLLLCTKARSTASADIEAEL